MLSQNKTPNAKAQSHEERKEKRKTVLRAESFRKLEAMAEDSKKEWNPLEEAVPENILKQIESFARDLAFLATKEIRGSIYSSYDNESLKDLRWRIEKKDLDKFPENYMKQFLEKWTKDDPDSPNHKRAFYPKVSLMLSFSYLQKHSESKLATGRDQTLYILTEKAFDLLNIPATKPTIFVSYRRYESSALAVLVETRLKLQDSQIGVFTDADIPLGDDWERKLEQSILDCEHFILLISHDTLSSEWVRQEIDWALESGSQIISICHSGYDLNITPENESPEEKQAREKLLPWQYHLIREENAKEYHSAMTELVRNLGYSTL